MLTDADCRNATCPTDKPRTRLADSGGLYLEVARSGGKRWFWKFYPDGKKESRLALGSYPEVGLKAARAARDEARKLHKAGTNPVQKRQADKATAAESNATTFEAVAREFHATKRDGWSDSHARQWLRCSEKDLFPALGTLPLDKIKAPALRAVLTKVQTRGAMQLAHDLREFAGQVFKHGIATGRCESNPAAALAGTLKPVQVRHMAAILEPAKVGELLRDIDGYGGQPATRAALLLAALLFQRPGNIRCMEWAHIDMEAALWTIPAAAMKRRKHAKANGRPHLVPLSRQALALLAEMQPLSAHRGPYVFPSLLSAQRPMSDNTMRNALRRLGYSNEEQTAHGFRAMARTLIAERLPGIAADVVEAQLAHGKTGPLGMAYDRAEFMDQRRQTMQAWADYLDGLRKGAKVVPLRAA